MTWEPIAPRRGNAKVLAAASPVTLGSIAAGGRYSQFCSVVARPALLDGGLPFWVGGQRVNVEIGIAEHAGLLRITPHATGRFRLQNPGGHSANRAAVLRLPPLPGMSAAAHKAQAVEHDWSDTWLEITLPPWARPATVKDPDGHVVRASMVAPPIRVAPGVPVPTKGNPFAVPKVARGG